MASSVPVKVKVTINNDVTTLFEDELLSEEEEGAVSLDIAVPAHAKCMKISVSTKLLAHTCTCNILRPYYVHVHVHCYFKLAAEA